VIVDNGSDSGGREQIANIAREVDCNVLQLQENFGVAAAQNHGISWARKMGCKWLVLLDQDSKPEPGMVTTLRLAFADLMSRGSVVAAVGPKLLDTRTMRGTPFVRINLFGVTKMDCNTTNDQFVLTDFLVSSGSLIPMTMFDQVGLPEEGLFIDNVDLEWCFRARSKGFLLYGVCAAVMHHTVGDQVIQVGNRVIHLHSPLRQYYIMRNRILLYQRSYSPWGWVLQDFWRMVFKLVFFALFSTPRRQNVHMMLKGIRDGLRRKAGKYR
jgi:rhamnosyltransferase